jgi:hypothetical protein
MGKTQVEALSVDLLPLVRGQASGQPRNPLSNGHQTMVLAGLYTVTGGGGAAWLVVLMGGGEGVGVVLALCVVCMGVGQGLSGSEMDSMLHLARRATNGIRAAMPHWRGCLRRPTPPPPPMACLSSASTPPCTDTPLLAPPPPSPPSLPPPAHPPPWPLPVLPPQTPQGWTLSCDGTTYPADSWGLLLPSLKTLMRRWPFLSAAEHAVIRPNELVLATRR